jgi:endoglucanase
MRKICWLLIAILLLPIAGGCTKRNPAAPANLFMQAATPVPTPASNLVLIENGEDGDNQNALGGYWYSYDDSANGGTSVVVPKPFIMTISPGNGANGSAGYVAITATVTTTYTYGFVGVGTGMSATSGGLIDLSAYQGLRLFIRGNGKQVRLNLKSGNITDSDFYGAVITATAAWQMIDLPFTSAVFRQQGFGIARPLADSLRNVTDLQWQSVGQPITQFDLQLDELYLYR